MDVGNGTAGSPTSLRAPATRVSERVARFENELSIITHPISLLTDYSSYQMCTLIRLIAIMHVIICTVPQIDRFVDATRIKHYRVTRKLPDCLTGHRRFVAMVKAHPNPECSTVIEIYRYML